MFISGGNFFDVIPYEGQYDAQPLALFSASKDSILVVPIQAGARNQRPGA